MENRLNVMTADAVTFHLEPAGAGSRTAAAGLDMLFQVIVTVLVLIPMVILEDRAGGVFQGYALAFVLIVLFLIFFGYHAFFEAIWAGQTPGKRICKLRVVKLSGQPIGVVEAVLRNIVRIVDYTFAIGFVVAVLSKKEQRLGDMMAGTIVIIERSYELPTVGERVQGYLLPAYEVEMIRSNRDRLTQKELNAIRNFLTYRDQLSPKRREEIAVQLAGLATKLGLQPRSHAEAEQFLDDLYAICME